MSSECGMCLFRLRHSVNSVLQCGQMILFFVLLHMEYISPGTINIHSRPSIINEPGRKTMKSPLWPHEGQLVTFNILSCYTIQRLGSSTWVRLPLDVTGLTVLNK